MALADALFDRLSHNAAVAALVGDRIEPDTSTSTTFPIVVYSIEPEQDATLGQDAVTIQYHVTLGIVALTRTQADAIAAAVKAALNDQTWTTGSTKVVAVTFIDATSDSQDDSGNKERIYHLTDQNYSIFADN
jgi:hypothetical protein